MMWRPIICYWYRPYNEWSVGNARMIDDRSREWRDLIMMRLLLSNAWRPFARRSTIYRRRNV